MTNLAQAEIEKLTPEEYSYYLAHGELDSIQKLNDVEYESYLKSHQIFDL